MSVRRSAGPSPAVPDGIKRFQEYRVLLDALNDGAVMPLVFPSLVRYGSAQSAVQNTWRGAAGVQTVYKEGADSKRIILVKPSAVNYCLVAFRPAPIGGAQALFPVASGLGGLSTTSAIVGGDPINEMACSIMGFIRKNAAGDNTSAWFNFGFSDLTVLNGNNTSGPKCGLIGDGAGGFRFGSVNAPDGSAVANPLARNAIDANAVQPAELVAPGANWFHVRIKMVPPVPSNNNVGSWEAYLNNNPTPVARFTTAANFPRGTQNVSHNYNRVEACIHHGNNTDAVTVEPGVMVHDLRVWLEDI